MRSVRRRRGLRHPRRRSLRRGKRRRSRERSTCRRGRGDAGWDGPLRGSRRTRRATRRRHPRRDRDHRADYRLPPHAHSRPRRASRGAHQSAQVHTLLAGVAAVVAHLSRSTLGSGFNGTLLDVQALSAEARKRPLSCNVPDTQQDPRPSLPTNDGGGPAFVRRIPHPCADGWLPGIRYSVRRAGGRALRARVFTSDTPSASPASLSVMRVPAFCRVKRPYRQAGSLPEQEFFGRLLSRRVTGVRLVGQVSRRAARRWPGRPRCACPPGCPAWP